MGFKEERHIEELLIKAGEAICDCEVIHPDGELIGFESENGKILPAPEPLK